MIIDQNRVLLQKFHLVHCDGRIESHSSRRVRFTSKVDVYRVSEVVSIAYEQTQVLDRTGKRLEERYGYAEMLEAFLIKKVENSSKLYELYNMQLLK